MPATSKFQFGLKGVAEELATGGLRVPVYQRDYAWGDDDGGEEVGEYWRDLQGVFREEGAEYFLGTVVISRDPDDEAQVGTIIDGQQRLATTAILLAAIRDEFRDRGDEQRANSIHETYLAKFDMRSGEDLPQIALNAGDNPFFQKVVVQGEAEEPAVQSHKLIERAYRLLRDRISVAADDAGTGWADRLTDWAFFLRNKARVIVVTVPTEADAFLIFETLNDRGADLTIADLLKNYLFGRAGTEIDSVRDAWVTVMAQLDIPVVGGKLFTDFLRQYWSSRYGATRERDLYRDIKERTQSQTQAVELATEMVHASRLYAAILNADHEFWFEVDETVTRQIDTLLTLNIEQNRPLLLAMMQHFTDAELARSMRAIASWTVRGLVVGGIGGGVTERFYCNAAMKVRSGQIKDADDLLTELGEIVPSDEQFRSAFRAARVTRGPLARYYLHALERQTRGTDEPELVPNEDKEQVNLEHVLPKNPAQGDWPEFSQDEAQSYVHRLGNMALLKKGPNGKIGNAAFLAKKPILEASELIWTRDAGEQEEWTSSVIDDRQGRMADLAVDTWPREPS